MKQEDYSVPNYTIMKYYMEMLKYSVNLNLYYQALLLKEMNILYTSCFYNGNQLKRIRLSNDSNVKNDKKFSLQELSYYDGTKGKPAYVAINGIVYDVSVVPAWGGGTHFQLYAGRDLTNQFHTCHNLEVLTKIPKVGTL